MTKYLLILFAIFLFSCSDDDKNIEPVDHNVNGIIPLKFGNYWLYEIEFFNTNDSVPEYSEIETYIIGDTIIDNTKYFMTLQQKNNYSFNRNNKNGYYYYSFDGIKDNDYLFYKYPCEVGDSWDLPIFPEEEFDSKIISVKSINSEIIVPFGKFNCINYELVTIDRFVSYDSIVTLVNYYFTPGIGKIKQTVHNLETRFDDTVLVYNMYLKNANINSN